MANPLQPSPGSHSPATLVTERLLLRRWREDDREPFAALNADPEVMRHFPATLSRAASDAMVDRIQRKFTTQGWGLWATEIVATGEFIGFVGLNPAPATLPLAPAVEVGWRLARTAWGYGYATEAAGRALELAFADPAHGGLGLAEVVSFTTELNLRSQRVMHRLGMTRDPADDFDRPALAGWSQARHVVYRLRA